MLGVLEATVAVGFKCPSLLQPLLDEFVPYRQTDNQSQSGTSLKTDAQNGLHPIRIEFFDGLWQGFKLPQFLVAGRFCVPKHGQNKAQSMLHMFDAYGTRRSVQVLVK